MHNLETPYDFLEGLVLRTPYFSFDQLLDQAKISSLLSSRSFLEAIYLASPVLYKECIKWINGELKSEKENWRVKISLTKYYQRMSSRCTPFGLFSATTFTKWNSDRTKVVLATNGFRKHSRLDMHCLCALSQFLAQLPGIKEHLLYFPNNSIYILQNEVRFVEYKYVNGNRMHQISSVNYSIYLRKVLDAAQQGITLNEIKEILKLDNIAESESSQFIEDILQAQLLVNELEPAITGKEFGSQILETLERLKTNNNKEVIKNIKILEKINDELKNIDKNKSGEISNYQNIFKLISSINLNFDESKLIQTDLFNNAKENFVSADIKTQLLSAFELLNKLYPDRITPNLSSFATRFQDRYGNNLMPLLQVLDTETGIGYLENQGYQISPLADELILPPKNDEYNYKIQWSPTEQWLFERLKKATTDQNYVITITDKDLENKDANWDDLPPSISAMFRIIDHENHNLLVKSFTGTSAANLLGRFSHGDESIHSLISEIVEKEQKLNPEVIFAEIIHLPESRIGNVLLHPTFRKFEIPYLAKASVSFDNTINLEDLYVTVENRRIKLFSKRLSKWIVPRLSSAHNFSNKTLPVYQFLGDLQGQNLRYGFSFHWGNMGGQFCFLPRVVYKKIILHEATWQLCKDQYAEFLSAIENNETQKITDFLKKWNLPTFFVLADSDNELLVNTRSLLSLQTFHASVKNRSRIILKEFLQPANDSIIDDDGKTFVNEFIAPIIKKKEVYTKELFGQRGLRLDPIQRTFVPGSEWLYYKFYCGLKSADKILSELIGPLTEKLLEEKIIDKWFFIRYHDPSFHLRIRFHVPSKHQVGIIMTEIDKRLQETGLFSFVWKMQLDTYQRELERYGHNTMELSEELFYHDSTSNIKLLGYLVNDEHENLRWLMGIRSAEELLNSFGYSDQQKQLFFWSLKEEFGKEFRAEKFLFLQLNKKFNENKNLIKVVLTKNETDGNNLDPVINVGQYLRNRLNPIAEKIQCLNKIHREKHLDHLLASYLHMSLNRLFRSDARLQEFIIYEFMNRWYLSQLKHYSERLRSRS